MISLFAEGTIELSPFTLVGIVTVLTGAVGTLFKLLISSKDSTIGDLKLEVIELKNRVKSYQSIGEEALTTSRQIADFYRQKFEGKPPIVPLAAVVTESNSPSTAKQREDAVVATMRAMMAQVRLETGLEPRSEPERSTKPGEV